jgi:hypothetical protein
MIISSSSQRYVYIPNCLASFENRLLNVEQVVYSAETFLAYSVGAWWFGLANNAMTDEQREALQPSDPEFDVR